MRWCSTRVRETLEGFFIKLYMTMKRMKAVARKPFYCEVTMLCSNTPFTPTHTVCFAIPLFFVLHLLYRLYVTLMFSWTVRPGVYTNENEGSLLDRSSRRRARSTPPHIKWAVRRSHLPGQSTPWTVGKPNFFNNCKIPSIYCTV